MIDHAKLEQAAALIAEVMRPLETTTAKCDHCPTEHYTHYGHSHLYNRLKALPKKLVSISEQIQRGCYNSRMKQVKGGS